jgi:ribosome biogenesis protein MAK21
MLIQQLSTSRHVAEERFFRTLYESLLDPRLVTSSKHALYLNLLFRSLKADLNVKRVKAFVKRLVQVITLHQPPFVCGVLYLLKELETAFQGLRTLLQDPEEWDDAEEVFKDVVEDDADVMQTVGNDEDLVSGAKKSSVDAFKYDGRKRDPEHSNADKSCLWELVSSIFPIHYTLADMKTRSCPSLTISTLP